MIAQFMLTTEDKVLIKPCHYCLILKVVIEMRNCFLCWSKYLWNARKIAEKNFSSLIKE